ANRAGGTIGGEKAMRATLEWPGMRGALSLRHGKSRKRCAYLAPGQARGDTVGVMSSIAPKAGFAKNLSPPSQFPPYSPSRPRAYGRKRYERLGGIGSGPLGVVPAEAQSGQMAGCG